MSVACEFSNADQTCGLVQIRTTVSLPIPGEACAYCLLHNPDPKTRRRSKVVESFIKQGRHQEKKQQRQAMPPAPVVSDPQARLEICTDCDAWSMTQERCKAKCGCKKRPRPLAAEGTDCPRSLWRRHPLNP